VPRVHRCSAQAKTPRHAVQVHVNMCGLLLTSLSDMKDQHPLPSKVLTGVIEKASAFTFSDIPTLKRVVAEHVADPHSKMQQLGKNTSVAAAQMERQEFDLMMAMFSHDLDGWKVYLTRSKDRQAAIHFQLLQYRQKKDVCCQRYSKGPKLRMVFWKTHLHPKSQNPKIPKSQNGSKLNIFSCICM